MYNIYTCNLYVYLYYYIYFLCTKRVFNTKICNTFRFEKISIVKLNNVLKS